MAESWYKLDNVAKLFVATNSRRDPRVFRISCTLNEEIDPAALDKALAKTAKLFRGFQVTLHQGLFWHYFEATDKVPHAVPETLPPCSALYDEAHRNGLLYRVCWYGSRITLEMFHALSDGTGGLGFLQTLVCLYLKEKHPEALADAVPEYDATAAERDCDSYRKFYGSRKAPADKKTRAYQLHSLHLPYDQSQFFEVHVPAGKLIAEAKGCGVSATSWLAAQLLLAIRADMPSLEKGRPVVLSLPVNLRNYYPSATARNFFNTIKVPCVFTGEETLEELARTFDENLRGQLTKENIMAQMDGFEKLERFAGVKPVPLVLKNPTVRFFNWLEKRRETATISNLGRVKADPALQPYIRGYSAWCSTSALFITVCSYGDDMVLGVTSTYRSTDVLKDLVRGLSRAGLDVALYASEVRG